MLNIHELKFSDVLMENILQKFFDEALVLLFAEDLFEGDVDHRIDVLAVL